MKKLSLEAVLWTVLLSFILGIVRYAFATIVIVVTLRALGVL